jgi:hypothetical protein
MYSYSFYAVTFAISGYIRATAEYYPTHEVNYVNQMLLQRVQNTMHTLSVKPYGLVSCIMVYYRALSCSVGHYRALLCMIMHYHALSCIIGHCRVL